WPLIVRAPPTVVGLSVQLAEDVSEPPPRPPAPWLAATPMVPKPTRTAATIEPTTAFRNLVPMRTPCRARYDHGARSRTRRSGLLTEAPVPPSAAMREVQPRALRDCARGQA